MTTFGYSSGDPTNLVGGGPAALTDISGPFQDLKDFVNGNIDTTNLSASAKPVTLLGAYRNIAEASGAATSESSGTKLFGTLSGDDPGLISSAANAKFVQMIPFNPDDYAVTGLTTKLRLSALIATNATAPASDFTFGLYPVTVAGGNSVIAATAGTVVSGSTVAIEAPAASTATRGAGSDFSAPSAGTYGLGVVLSDAQAANSIASIIVQLQLHHV